MQASRYMLQILGLFLLGIAVQYFFQLNAHLVFTAWMGGLILLLFTGIEKAKEFLFQRIISIQILFLFFLGGMLALASSSSGFYKMNYTKRFLPGDELIARVIDYKEGSNNYDKILLRSEQVVSNKLLYEVDGTLLAYIQRGGIALNVGDVIVCNPRLNAIRNKGNPGEFDAEHYWKTKGVEDMVFLRKGEFKVLDNTPKPFFDRLRNYLKRELEQALPPDLSSLAIALSLGDKGGLSKETRDNFANAGAMHVLAVSGLHVGILLGIVQWIFYQVGLLRKKRVYILCAIGMLWFFALLTGLAPSVFRATLMFSFLGFGQLLGRRFFSLNALLVSGLILLMLDANTLFDIGFQLSFLALLGILFFFQPIANLWAVRNKWVDKLWQGTALGLAAQIGTIPVSLYYFHQFPNYFILTNIGLTLVSGVALGGVLLFFISSKIPIITDVMAFALEHIFGGMASFVRWIDHLPFSVARGFTLGFWQVWVAYGSLIILLFAYRSQRLRLWYVAVLTVFLCSLQFIYVRHTSEFKHEAIVFNSPTPLILVKNEGVNYFLLTVKTEDELKKLDFIVSAYERKYSGSSVYIPIEENQLVEITTRSKPIALMKWHMNGLHVLVDDSEVLIPLEERYVNPDNTALVIGSWLKSPRVENGYQLERGAYYWK